MKRSRHFSSHSIIYTLVSSWLMLACPETADVSAVNDSGWSFFYRPQKKDARALWIHLSWLYLRAFAEKSCRKFSAWDFSTRRRPSLRLTRSSRTPPCWQSYGSSGSGSPYIQTTLKSLFPTLFSIVFCFPVRQRKDELEQRMSTLQESRRELMVQLEQLMMLLKVQ